MRCIISNRGYGLDAANALLTLPALSMLLPVCHWIIRSILGQFRITYNYENTQCLKIIEKDAFNLRFNFTIRVDKSS